MSWTGVTSAARSGTYLTSKGAAINHQFVNMTVEVPRDTGESAPRAIWKLDGALRITTEENASKPV